MTMLPGQRLKIVKGTYKGRKANFVSNAGLLSVNVKLDGTGEIKCIRKSSVEIIVVDQGRENNPPPPPFPRNSSANRATRNQASQEQMGLAQIREGLISMRSELDTLISCLEDVSLSK